MNSLKKKFGKFAISQTKATNINGGTPPKPNLWLHADCGGVLYTGANIFYLTAAIVGDGASGCTLLS